jgi:hypothetical protein
MVNVSKWPLIVILLLKCPTWEDLVGTVQRTVRHDAFYCPVIVALHNFQSRFFIDGSHGVQP